MYNIKEHPISWTILLRVGDLLGATLAIPLSFWASCYFVAIPTPDANRMTMLNCIFAVCILIYYFQQTGLYHSRSFLHKGSMIRRLLLSMALLVATFILLRELAAPHRDFGYVYFVILYAGITFITVLCIRLLVRWIEVRFLLSMRTERVAFVGWSLRLEEVLEGLSREMLFKQTIEGYFTVRNHSELQPTTGTKYQDLGSLDDLRKILEERKITLVVVDQREISSEKLEAIELACSDLLVTLRMIPWTPKIWTHRLMIRAIGGVAVFGVKDLSHDRTGNKLIRRLVDIIGSLVGIILSAPIIAIMAILIKRESPGPVFYRQTRLGLNKKHFDIIKLRSMRLDAEKEQGVGWTVENDPRRLKIGGFMRKWNLDELPQFWNVLKGEMSLVGPRPERPEFVEKFRDSMHYYNLRHSCKPGMTGWAAVHGLRGNTSLEERLSYDLYYIENWSLLLDFRIMLMTLISHHNAY
jgi:exopolysaccharide biosynthesis polyprenyl glycosylphosphotransferase